jgi:hypothetical protein
LAQFAVSFCPEPKRAQGAGCAPIKGLHISGAEEAQEFAKAGWRAALLRTQAE